MFHSFDGVSALFLLETFLNCRERRPVADQILTFSPLAFVSLSLFILYFSMLLTLNFSLKEPSSARRAVERLTVADSVDAEGVSPLERDVANQMKIVWTYCSTYLPLAVKAVFQEVRVLREMVNNKTQQVCCFGHIYFVKNGFAFTVSF